MSATVSTLREDQREAAFALRVAAFSATAVADVPDDLDRWYAALEHRVGVVDDDELVGHATCWPFGMWLRGGLLPTQGVASLTIAAHRRGEGLGGLLVRSLLDRAVAVGQPLSALYPTTAGLYRRHGYAVAGTRTRRTVPTALLASLPAPADPPVLRPMVFPDDVAALAAVQRRDAARTHGRLSRDDARTANLWEPDDGELAWVAVRDGQVVGGISTARVDPAPGDRSSWSQRILDLAADDHDVRLALLRLAGQHAAGAARTRYTTGPDDLVLDSWVGPSADLSEEVQHWMARVVDVPGAVAASGWSADLDVALRITDPLLPSVDGVWRLAVRDGRGTAARAADDGADVPTVDVGGFTQLLTGWSTASSLAGRRRLVGASAGVLEVLDAAFRSPSPVMHDYF